MERLRRIGHSLGRLDGMLSRRQTKDDQSQSTSKDTLFWVFCTPVWGCMDARLVVTQALAGEIDRGDPMGVQEVLGKSGMERG